MKRSNGAGSVYKCPASASTSSPMAASSFALKTPNTALSSSIRMMIPPPSSSAKPSPFRAMWKVGVHMIHEQVFGCIVSVLNRPLCPLRRVLPSWRFKEVSYA